MINQRATSKRRWLEYGWLMTGLLATCWLVFQAAPASLFHARANAETTSGITAVLRTASIEDIRVGDRVVADAGDAADKASDLFGIPASWDSEPVDPQTWKKITFLYRADDATVDIVLLRPLTWIEETGAQVGGTVDLILPEQAVDGEADVVSIEDCPPIAPGIGSVVTGTFTRVRPGILHLYVAGVEKPIGVTANHSIYSVDRGEFVHASELSAGETLRLLHGDTRVTRIEPIEGEQQVYNLEVHGAHVFHVSKHGVLVHNATATADEAARAGKAVLGHFPDYIKVGKEVDGRVFNIPKDVWERMTEAERWAANQKFLDELLSRGDEIILATPEKLAREGSYFRRELDYLISKGCRISEDGTRVILPAK